MTVAVFEVDGSKEVIFCQNLCLISKLFLDHKTLFYDTKIFLFYVLCEVDENGCRFVAYFSKEKEPDGHTNNLACILTLPCHQRKGYGHFMISLSYELSIIEKKTGGPEKPLSDLGRVSYESYWSQVLVETLVSKHDQDTLSIEDLGKTTGILHSDVLAMLEQLNILKYIQGQHIFEISEELTNKFIKKERKLDSNRIYVRPCQPEKLKWVPYLSLADFKKLHHS